MSEHIPEPVGVIQPIPQPEMPDIQFTAEHHGVIDRLRNKWAVVAAAATAVVAVAVAPNYKEQPAYADGVKLQL